MKKLTTLLLLLFCLPLAADPLMQDDAAIDPRVKLTVTDPERDVGYVIGDKLTRTIRLEVQKPYQLLDTSLPIVGYEKRWKGQVIPIELRELRKETAETGKSTIYTLHLTYQVFTTNLVAKPAALPAEILKFTNKKEVFDFRIPSWSFRVSPLAVYGSVVIERDMSGLRGPLLLNDDAEQKRLKLWLGLLGFSLLGLLYIFGKYAWLPLMGRPFARAYREIKRLPDNDSGIQQAVSRLHQAINNTAGASVFNADGLIAAHPGFAGLRSDLEQFFTLSRQVYFDPAAASGVTQPAQWLRKFCMTCRHYERGLK